MQRRWVRESSGWVGALALSLLIAAQVSTTARADLLFRDGDSLIVALFARSAVEGQGLDWAMSSVLFLPESALFAGLDLLLPLDVNGVLAANAVVNLLALYGALRLAAGARTRDGSPVVWSLIGLAAFGVLAMTEISASRDALELASLQLTTTYYSATVVGVVATVGLVRRALDQEARAPASYVALGVIAAVCTLSNPLFAIWAGVPLALILLIGTLRGVRRERMLALLAVLLGGIILGLLARIPFAAWIANTGAGYFQPQDWATSAAYYAGLLSDRLSTPLGVLGSLIMLALLAFAVWRSLHASSLGSRLVALSAWAIPVLVVIGAIAMGTHAARYLQPLAFAPVLALVTMPRITALPRRLARQVSVVAAIILLVIAGVSIPRLQAAASAPDTDLQCVTDWVSASGRTGAGQFWTIRLPKLHLDDPSQLVQVDHRLNGYAWLVDRTDFAVGEVTFLVEDDQTAAWELPVAAVPDLVISCGGYRILDFEKTSLPLGPAHS